MSDEEIDGNILEFVRQNPGTTINKVTGYLTSKNLLSYVPACKKVISLIENGIIEDRKKGNSFHRLFINDKSHFNIIDSQLTEIESAIDVFQQDFDITESLEFDDKLTSKHIQKGFKDLDFTNACNQLFLLMLKFLLVENATKIKSPNHSQVLFNRIVNLMIKLDLQMTHDPRLSKLIYKYLISRDLALIERDFKSYVNRTGKLNHLSTISQNFKQNILE